MSRGGNQDDGIMSWVLLAFLGTLILGALSWLVGSHKIVFYSAKLFDLLAFPWRLLPKSLSGTVVKELDVNYILAMRHAAHFPFSDWVSYANLAVKPWSYITVAVMGFLTLRQFNRVKSTRLNEQLSPPQLAELSMKTFTEIAPVLHIQEKLVHNKVKGWDRQVFPEEFLQKARYQGQKVLVPSQREDGQLILDKERLHGFLTQTRTYRHRRQKLMSNRFLGRQLVDVRSDLKKGRKVYFVDRLSNEGKAIFAMLAPYTYGKGPSSKKDSQIVKDALNMSAYGSPDGKANLSVEEAQASFEEWRKHPAFNRIAMTHHWEYPFLCSLLERAQKRGKIGSWWFVWLKPMDRIMYYALNTVGRETPHTESGLCFSQTQFDKEVSKMGRLPIDRRGKSIIFSDRLIESLEQEWSFWLEADPVGSGDDNLFDFDSDTQENSALINHLLKLNETPYIPEEEV